MMNHLLQRCQAQRIVFVGGVETNIDTQARYRAWRNALRNAGIEPRATDVFHLDYTYESAYRLAIAEIGSWTGPRHFVFAANDEMAAGIIAAAVAKGFSVPKELGVVGFDDTRVAQMIKPPLTTVRVPMSKMGATAIELLCQRIADPQRSPTRVSLPAELVVRESCGCNAGVA
jgi:LacI family transcriptional regulator